MESDMREAIRMKEFTAYYQPIVALSSLKIVGFEALISWQHPERGIIPTDEFIQLAEETKLIEQPPKQPPDLWLNNRHCNFYPAFLA